MIVSYQGLNDLHDEGIIDHFVILLEISILELRIAIIHWIFPLPRSQGTDIVQSFVRELYH